MSFCLDEEQYDVFLHASRSEEFRFPFGAMPTDSEVTLRFKVPSGTRDVTLCYSYGLYDFTYHEEPMRLIEHNDNFDKYEVVLMCCHEPGLVFYWFKFRLDTEYSEQFYYVAEADTDFGSGKIYHEPPRVGANEDKYPYAWQITVYEKDSKTPDSIKGAKIYQIFPDRFARDKNFDYKKMISYPCGPERLFHKDWNEDVDIEGKPETGYLACDFYGGSLYGIIEKLDYIKSLGIDIIYMNPIFMARSSHRYDTANYKEVDPILGGNEAFEELSKEASKRGIKIIIDGVFSHTGADSIYFNKFNRFDGVGAYEAYTTGKESKYRSWYSFIESDDDQVLYHAWWGFPDLPNVDENNLSYRQYIFGKDGVVDTWTSRGASGIRLDVSDELPDSFIRQMRDTLKSYTNGEGILIGEVWEDASNKCSYGSYRDFLLGRTHDSVMGYTFRKEVLDYLCGYITARQLNSRLEGYRERYPLENYYSIMNLISSHDVPRAFTILGKIKEPDNRPSQRYMWVEEERIDEITALMRLAYAFQMAYVGCPTTYYGDEILMQGYKDPFNRRTYPWDNVDERAKKHLDFCREIAELRTNNPCLKTGFIETLYADDDVLVIKRYLKDGKDAFGNVMSEGADSIIFAMNRSDKDIDISINNNDINIIYKEENLKDSDTFDFILDKKSSIIKRVVGAKSFLFVI
ncbi:MAG: glycoside hydrolase family 13 protein [Clostridia bacterium]|nr:glycoside hydrolase family 13 protein [Clostridia bacterium]